MKQSLLLAALAFILCLAPQAQAVEQSTEYRVKAAYLYNFAKFIHWPDSAFSGAKAPLIIGVLGKNSFNGTLKPLVGKKLRGRIIDVKYFNRLEEVSNCQLLYISSSDESNLKQILPKLATRPIVTVGETHNYVDFGGTIQFITKRGRLRFSINLDIAQSNNIQIEAQLLSLAAKVVKGKK